MNTTTLLFIIVFAVLIWLYVQNCYESFEIEPNTIVGGYQAGPEDLELEGPGDAAWSGY
uniref:Uncharacterized protein n=1 Tax=Marseillevirus LCMAC202 TaxID=2506606 RepID=A0A481YZ78_9VIRU|nr:MAG: hypothetical protein LCMAC202_05930 [Marseillevirus LCMAC202]